MQTGCPPDSSPPFALKRVLRQASSTAEGPHLPSLRTLPKKPHPSLLPPLIKGKAAAVGAGASALLAHLPHLALPALPWSSGAATAASTSAAVSGATPISGAMPVSGASASASAAASAAGAAEVHPSIIEDVIAKVWVGALLLEALYGASLACSVLAATGLP